MIKDIKDIEWEKIRSYSIDRHHGVLDEIVLETGLRFNVSHLNVREQDVEYYMNGGVMNSRQPVQQYHEPEPTRSYEQPQENYGQQQGYEPHQQQQPQQQDYPQQQSQGGGGARNAAATIENNVQWFFLMFLVALGGFVAFSFHLAKRLVVDKLNMTIFDLFEGTKEKFGSIFGGTLGNYFPDVVMPENGTVYNQTSMIIAFCLLGLPMLWQVIKRPSKVLYTVIFYVVSLVAIAAIYNLGVANDFLEIMGSFPPLISLNPFDLFGYVGR